jgi:HAD superfamily hydrolase (TIGR01490 family)
VTLPLRVAVFDLDGTITRRDTFLPYIAGWLRRHPARAARLWRVPAALLRFALGGRDRGRLKSDLLRIVLGAANRVEVQAWSAEFVASLAPPFLHEQALAAIRRHREAGDRLVLLSASVDLYVPLIGARLGFDETVCTGVRWDGDRLDGRLTTENRRGEEKRRVVAALRERFAGSRFAAYGNAASDFAHLAIVEEPLLVNAGTRARREGQRRGLPLQDWTG